MKKLFVITIGRQYGSGGRDIGIKLASLLGVNFYDHNLISEISKRSGLCSKVIEKEDEKVPNTLRHALSFGYSTGFSPDSIYKIQSDVIIDIASKESCVIVGRSADYVLRNNPRALNIFINSPIEDRIERVMARTEVVEKEALESINKTDKGRAAYYDYYTNKRWSDCRSYHLSIDSSVLGLDDTAKLICDFAKNAFL